MKLRLPKPDLLSIAIVAAYAAIIAILVYKHNWEFETSVESLTWQQPASITVAPLISPNNQRIKLATIEETLGTIQFTQGKFEHNTHTISAIEKAIKYIPKDATKAESDHIFKIISKIHPQHNALELTDLIKRYQSYLDALNTQTTKGRDKKDIDDAEKELHLQIALKHQYLGKALTEKLFAKRHAMANYILQRRKVLSNQQLSHTQKQEKISQLERMLKNISSRT